MERLGLVSDIEAQLERVIGAGMLPEDGKLPSEQMLARRHGVSRTTIREALGRLAARGLVVQHPGRQSRAVALDETVTLENLGVALHGMGVGRAHSERRRLLEGYFALKRETLVELLAACREHAPKWELERVRDACFALWNAARWEEEDWVAREFELLRLAARAAQRPGQLLLIHSLERAFRGIQARVRPHLDAPSVTEWAYRAMLALAEAEPLALKRELLPLLRACDERVLERLAPAREADDLPRASCDAAAETPHVETEPVKEALRQPECRQPETRGPHPGAREERSPSSSLEGAPPPDSPGSCPGEQSPYTATLTAAGSPSWRSGGWAKQGLPCPTFPGGGGRLPAVAERSEE